MIKQIPLSGTPTQRQQGTGDQRFVNIVFEKIADTDEYLMCTKRPCLSNYIQPTGTSTGRGMYGWGFTSTVYSVYNNVLYAGTTSTVALNTSTGRVWFVETNPTDSNHIVIACDGQDNYNITSSNVVTQIDESDSASYPVSSVGSILYIDGYLVQGQGQGTSSGRIVNSNLNSVTSWAATAFESIDGRLEALHIQKDQILALGKKNIEFYFNNGNPSGSPFLRIDQNTLDFGIASRNSLAWAGETALFVSESDGENKNRSVMRVDSLRSIKDVSTPVINRFLDAEGQSISSCTAWMAPVGGQTVYCLNLQFANRSFAYNADNNTWTEWEAAAGGRFNGVSATTLNGVTYIQDATNGRIYSLNASTYQDSGSAVMCTIQTQRLTFGSVNRKYQRDLHLLGDTTTGTVSCAIWDNDFQSSTLAGTFDMSKATKYITRLGSFYSRGYTLLFNGNAPLRLQFLRTNIDEGLK